VIVAAADPAAGLTVGAQLAPLELPPVSRATLALFAGVSGDHNPIHIDIDAAHAAGEPDVFAHGMLSMAWLGRLLTDRLPQARLATWTVRFVAKTPVHAQVTCRASVAEVDGDRLVLDVRTELADGTVTLRGTATYRPDQNPDAEVDS
jgi:acyl dehydratase